MSKRISLLGAALLMGGLLSLTIRPGGAFAASLCVNQGGTAGCYSTIAAAVTAASAGDTVTVAAGTYTEHGITITTPVTLQGAGAGSTTIDATGHTAGLTISGITTGNTSISGFTIENAGLQGIFVVNSAHVTIQNNTLMNNDKSLVFNPKNPNATKCPDTPNPFLADDCGEAINLQGSSFSTVANNLVQLNAGGILLDDESGPTHDNTITGNTVQNNKLDCGITLASHASGVGPAGPKPGFGIFSNTITNNTVSGNGAAGVGIFASVPGDAAYNNLVQGNTITNNGLPGVTLHSHAPGQNINGNQIIGNTLSGNGVIGDPDAGDSVTTGILILGAVVPASNITIANNTISNEAVGIWLTGAGPLTLSGNANSATTPIYQLGSSSVAPGTGPVTLPNGNGLAGNVVSVSPTVTRSNAGQSASFTVNFTSATAGQAEVYFGTSCSGLVEVATNDTATGGRNHSIVVTGNDLPGTVGDVGITPGQTYYFEVVTITPNGNVVDNNGGGCYTVSIPQS